MPTNPLGAREFNEKCRDYASTVLSEGAVEESLSLLTGMQEIGAVTEVMVMARVSGVRPAIGGMRQGREDSDIISLTNRKSHRNLLLSEKLTLINNVPLKPIQRRETMLKTRSGYKLAGSVAALAVFFAFSAINPAYSAERKSIRWATSSTGSYGYKVAAQMIKVLEDALGGEYTVTVNPYPSTTGAMKATMDGGAEIGYTADVGMTQVYEGEGGFKNYNAAKSKMVHTWYAYPMESFMATHASKAGQFKSWGDFSGKPVFFTPAGFMNWLNFQRIFKALGYQFKHVQIGEAAQGDALQSGSIVGAVAYTTAGASLASYWRETELRTDLRVINPTADEIKKLKEADLAPVEIDASKAFSKDVGVKTILGVPILFGYNVRADMPEDVVYKMLNRFYKERDSLAKIDPGFTPMARDFVGMQVNGIKANPAIPVHAGLAKFLKEHNAWNDKWTIAGK
jgi:hypothetical protein